MDATNDFRYIALHMSHNNFQGEALPGALVATIVLDLDVQVQRAITTIHFPTIAVWTDKLSFYLLHLPPVVFFVTDRSTRECLLCLKLLEGKVLYDLLANWTHCHLPT